MGSLGDLHPYLALGLHFQKIGFQVTLATHGCYRQRVQSFGLQFLEQMPDLRLDGDSDELHQVLNNPRQAGEYLIRQRLLPGVKDNIEVLLKHAPYDLIVTNTLTFGTAITADILRTPCLSVVLTPITFFSTYDPPILLPVFANPFWKNQTRLHRVLLNVAEIATTHWLRPLSILRRDYGLSDIKGNILMRGYFRREGTLILLPEFFAKPQPDWPKYEFLGFPLLRGTSPNIPVELENFLTKVLPGEDLTIYTLGSFFQDAGNKFFQSALELHRQTKTKALFIGGARAPSLRSLLRVTDQNIYVLDYVDYHQVFPRASRVVHHGGIGSIGEALSAGVPQVIVPFVNDQPENARRCEQLKVSVTMAKNRISPQSLTEAFQNLQANVSPQHLLKFRQAIAANDLTSRLRSTIERVLPLEKKPIA